MTFQDKSINLAGFMVDFLLDEEKAGNAFVTKSILENIHGHKSIAKSPYFWKDRCDLNSSARIHAANVHKFLLQKYWKDFVTKCARQNHLGDNGLLNNALEKLDFPLDLLSYCFHHRNFLVICDFMTAFEIVSRDCSHSLDSTVEKYSWMYELPER